MAEVKDVLEDYPLSRDFVDFSRLNLQHYLWKEIFGYALHPKISRDRKLLRIADVGTGTGIWLRDLASQLDASAELLGLDTDITQAGPPEWLPVNMSLREWSVFTDVPDDLIAKFDIVHLRLFCWVIKDDPEPVLKNLIKLLKPGGYLQWSDVDVQSMQIVTSSPDVPRDKLVALWDETVPEDTRLRPGWSRDLAGLFEKHGLQGVEADWQIGKHDTRLAMHWCNLQAHEMVAARLREVNPQKASEIDALVQAAAAESRKGAMYSIPRVNAIGKKPLA
ncbi:S-adenosyl-L-methionine-dependent methyltransferase [Hypoxylon sp. NC0597]|nr:S-adenosyl-L-methionine-dependent methyltransferase [Hypoxylon sp. NC0597]